MPEIDVVDLHRRYVRIPSISRDEGPLAEDVRAYLSASSLDVLKPGNNVVATLGEGPRTLLLCTHLDTVPPSRNHPHGIYDANIVDGQVWGRGAVDAKASLAGMTHALYRLASEGWTPPDGRVVGAFTACEETGGENNGLEEVLPGIGRIDAALVGEPTHMHPCIAQKGLLILRLDSPGVSAHAARPAGGDNAIMHAAEDILALSRLEFDRVHPELGETTLQVTTIDGGSARNVIPDLCSFYVDIRSTPAYRHEEIVEMVRATVRSAVHIHSDRFVPVGTDAHDDIVRVCLEAHPGSATFGSPTMSDWIYLKGIPTVKIGPGDSRLSHTSEERIETEELQRASDMYRDIILRYFG
jgi:acetylornithine deacetylase